MDLAPFQDFLIACVGASASFIGLLFVALSVVLARQGENIELEFTDRRLAESAFTALVNVFFVCLIALLPTTNIGYAAFVMAVVGLRSSWLLFGRFQKIQKTKARPHSKREAFWISASLLAYLLQGIYAVRLIMDPTNITNLYVMTSILLTLFGGGLVRAWELTGIRSGRRS